MKNEFMEIKNIFEERLSPTVAYCEKAHSKIKPVKMYFRVFMSEGHLESFTEFSIKRDLADKATIGTSMMK